MWFIDNIFVTLLDITQQQIVGGLFAMQSHGTVTTPHNCISMYIWNLRHSLRGSIFFRIFRLKCTHDNFWCFVKLLSQFTFNIFLSVKLQMCRLTFLIAKSFAEISMSIYKHYPYFGHKLKDNKHLRKEMMEILAMLQFRSNIVSSSLQNGHKKWKHQCERSYSFLLDSF